MSDDKSENEKKEESSNSHSPAFDGDKKIARKFISQGAETLIRWMPLGGSGSVLLTFFLQQEWLMALLMFPIMIVTVIWAAYSKSVLTRFGEIYAERGKQDVDSLMTWIDRIDKAIKETIKWQLAGVEDKYLECQGNACIYYTTEGTSSTFKPQLKDVFVPLELSAEFIRDESGENIPNPRGYQWDKQLAKLMSQQDALTIWDVLKRVPKNPAYRTLGILAWGGYGKTTLLRHITYTYYQKRLLRGVPKLLPVLLLLRKWQTLIAEEKPDLVTLIEKHHIPSLPQGNNLKRPENWAKNQLNQGNMLVMLDGFDEVKEEWRESVGEWIAQMMHNYSSSYFILSSRPAGYESYTAENKPNILRLKAFNEAQRERFINQWYLTRERHISAEPDNPVVKQTAQQKSANLVQQLQEREELNDLAKNPLLLNMIVNLHSVALFDSSDLSRKIQLPQRRSELYREIFRLQLGDRPLVKQISMCLEADKSQRILQGLALYMVQENNPAVNYNLLFNVLGYSVNSFDNSVNIEEFIKQIIYVSELLVKKNEDYQFAHLSFQGYLAAKEIIDTKQDNLLIDNWDKSWWRETILLYSAQVNPNNLLRQLIEIGTKDAVTLALRCLEETPRKIEAEVKTELDSLKEKLKIVLFDNLKKYLKNKQWKDADKETNQLMLQLGDKDEKGYLNFDDCRNFPREELRTIDRLWLDNSEGKFGFSVQKRIYLEEGGKLDDYDYDSYERMSDRIGWYKNNEWLSYSKLIFDNTTAPQGHLPGVFRGLCSGGVALLACGGGISLFSSLDSNT